MLKVTTPPLLKRKDYFYVPATKQSKGRGRPSGGLDMYASLGLGALHRSSSGSHVAISCGTLWVVGVYYKPSLEIDDVVHDLSSVLSMVPRGCDVVVGGDFNLEASHPSFEILSALLSNYGLALISNPNISTYHSASSQSSIDHIFSTRLNEPTTDVMLTSLSDHCLINVVSKFGRRIIRERKVSNPVKVEKLCPSSRKKIDHSRLSVRLGNIQQRDPPHMVTDVVEAFQECQKKIKIPKVINEKKPWFTPFHRALRHKMLQWLRAFKRTRGDYERYRYCLSRNAYHLSLRRSERTNQITTAKAIFDDIEYGVERVREKNV